MILNNYRVTNILQHFDTRPFASLDFHLPRKHSFNTNQLALSEYYYEMRIHFYEVEDPQFIFERTSLENKGGLRNISFQFTDSLFELILNLVF